MRWILIIPFCLAGCDPGFDPLGAANVLPENKDGDAAGDSQVLADPVEDEALVVATTARGPLGRTVASLGDATEPGMWLKTPLVSVQGPGRVSSSATGRSAEVTLIPISGPATAGSRLSLQAMQTLGLSLTDLPEIEVFAGGQVWAFSDAENETETDAVSDHRNLRLYRLYQNGRQALSGSKSDEIS